MAKMTRKTDALQLQIALFLILVTVSTGGAFAKSRCETNDTLLTAIKEKSIREMTDGEFRYFFEYQKDIDDFNSCDDHFLKVVAEKEIKEMTPNEYEYFEQFILDCDNVVPCSLRQYLQIKDKKPFSMTNNELEFYNGCTRECEDYMESYHPTKEQRRKKYFRIISFSTLTVLGAVLGAVGYSLFTIADDRK